MKDGCTVALAGNPNVGKSTVFNALTGLNQHTGNWPGKTVAAAWGKFAYRGRDYELVDLPGTYSLSARSAEEEIARDFLTSGRADAAVVVCDATCLERNMNLALQTMELVPGTILCVNLMDEARKKGARVNIEKLSARLGVPVVATGARNGEGLDTLMEAVRRACETPPETSGKRPVVSYPEAVENAVAPLARRLGSRHAAMLALPEPLQDQVAATLVREAEAICRDTAYGAADCARDRKIDKILTSRVFGFPIMLALLCGILWLTVTGANYPSQWIANGLFRVQDWLYALFTRAGAPFWLRDMLVLGMYRVLAWVAAVMLPPMALFFPLFTLLEDFGYLPRVAFMLDSGFKKCRACGKQALTMCMGFGCNAAGVTGCRIIDSPRERLIATLTNVFVPCNGRFPTLIAVICIFFAGIDAGPVSTLLSALLLSAAVVLGVALTLGMSRLLSATLLKGRPSAFILELPPYRAPQIGKVLYRSLLDRTLFVLGRAVVVAAPAGLVIWVMANVTAGGVSLLAHSAAFLDPFARLLGLDGVILLAFILGFPANEIVVPIILMAYLSSGSLLELNNLYQMKELLTARGWTWATAVSVILFCLAHWPCSTTVLTVRKEAGFKWALAAMVVPAAAGMALCFLFTTAVRLFA